MEQQLGALLQAQQMMQQNMLELMNHFALEKSDKSEQFKGGESEWIDWKFRFLNAVGSGSLTMRKVMTFAEENTEKGQGASCDQGTGTTSRVSATHVGAAITDAASSSTAGVCSDGSHSTARGNATSSNGVDIRGDAAKDLARVVRDGSTPEGRRLREQWWVWLHLQDEEATGPVPKQLQSWLNIFINMNLKNNFNYIFLL